MLNPEKGLIISCFSKNRQVTCVVKSGWYVEKVGVRPCLDVEERKEIFYFVTNQKYMWTADEIVSKL